MWDLNAELGTGDEVRISPVDAPESGDLKVLRPYSDQRDNVCYLDSRVLDSIGVQPGEEVEIYNADTGGRILLTAAALAEKDADREKIRIDLHSTKVLDVDFGDIVRVRRPIDTGRPGLLAESRVYGETHLAAIRTSIFEPMVGTRRTYLRIGAGLDQDEYRGIVRLNESTMRYLGVEAKDRVNISWKGGGQTFQCLPIPEERESDGFEILLPSSARDQLEVSPFDGVPLWRSTIYEFQKQVSLSLLGILGVVVGTFQVAETTTISQRLLNSTGWLGTLLVLIFVSALISIPVVWFLLLPIRNEVRGGA
jgi:aspartate 1-decarboxylase